MKMYACKKWGKYNTLGTSWHFTGIRGLDREKVALKANKRERELFLRVGFDLEKATEEYGSTWLEKGEIKRIRNKLELLSDLGETDELTVKAIIEFMGVCLEQGYRIRFY